MLTSHYAPAAALRLDAEAPHPDEAFLAFGPAKHQAPNMLNLSESGDLKEAAANLFAYMRALDALCTAQNLSGIAAAPDPPTRSWRSNKRPFETRGCKNVSVMFAGVLATLLRAAARLAQD